MVLLIRLIRLLAVFLLSCDDSKWFFTECEHKLEAWELLDKSSDLGNNKMNCMVVCEWQKSTVFPYHWVFSREMTKNDAYLKQMLVHCITVRDGKSSCSQVVSIRQWLSGHFISFPTGGTEILALTDNGHLSYCCLEFPHLPNAAMADNKNKINFSLFHPFFYHMLPSHFTFRFAIQISSPSPFSFSHTSVFSPCVSLLYIVFLFLHSILSSLHFLSFNFCLFLFYC